MRIVYSNFENKYKNKPSSLRDEHLLQKMITFLQVSKLSYIQMGVIFNIVDAVNFNSNYNYNLLVWTDEIDNHFSVVEV